MRSNALVCHSFLISTLVLYTIFCDLVLGANVIVDDQDNNPNVTWNGAWKQYHRIHAKDQTLTRGNKSGETVTFTFTGISVQVFGAFRPIGTWDMRSIYTVDDGSHTEFIPSREVDELAYNIQFYDSGPLEWRDHTLKIENLGVQLWLDYFQFDDGNHNFPSGSTSTITATVPPSSSIIIITPLGSSSAHNNGSGDTTASSLMSSPHLSATTSDLSSELSAPPTVSSPFVSPSSFPRLHSPSLSYTLSPYPPVQTQSSGAGEPQGAAHSQGISHSVLIGLTIAAIVGVVLLALLFQLGRASLRECRIRTSLPHIPVISDPPHSDSHHRPPTVPDIQRAPSATAWARDVISSCSEWLNVAVTRSRDGGVRIAGGMGVSNAEAPSIWSGESEKSILPPPYEEHLAS